MNLDFSDTQIAFAYKSDNQLRRATFLFSLMNRPRLSKFLRNASNSMVKANIPGTKIAIKNTIFTQFLGGENLSECKTTIESLREYNILTVLDYSAEGKSEETDLDQMEEEFIKALEFAASQSGVPLISLKISALADNALLRKWQNKELFSTQELKRFERVRSRLDEICRLGQDLNVRIFIDAEESWIQDCIDYLATEVMHKYNQETIVVYTTYQMYRKDTLQKLKDDYEHAKEKNYILGAKIVRGAYMEKERKRAKKYKYPSPIHDTKADTDADYNAALNFVAERYDHIASCAATHNAASCHIQAQNIERLEVRNNHPHLNFCQLYGMSDNITFNLANYGYNVAKYLPYGSVEEVLPYLIRRIEENSAVSNEMSREYLLHKEELKRRNKS